MELTRRVTKQISVRVNGREQIVALSPDGTVRRPLPIQRRSKAEHTRPARAARLFPGQPVLGQLAFVEELAAQPDGAPALF
ncbi:hypothetical protein AB0N88_04800 [Streptomyces sp. NPDC093516]|uniref:hypothetical protein n=1 Tax=Streptomyces sp. NPDC093516 TaxID=3155304 RepID=UPI00341FC103